MLFVLFSMMKTSSFCALLLLVILVPSFLNNANLSPSLPRTALILMEHQVAILKSNHHRQNMTNKSKGKTSAPLKAATIESIGNKKVGTECSYPLTIPKQHEQQCPPVRPTLLTSPSTERQRKMSRFLNKLFDKYDRRLFPTVGNDNDTGVLVKAALFVSSVDSVNEISFDYELVFFLHLSWRDKRLAFDPRMYLDGAERCDLPPMLSNQIWLPDIFIKNEKNASFYSITTPNQLLTLEKNGSLFFSRRVLATVNCPMNLRKFPFDCQHCEMVLESFAYTERHIILDWLTPPLEIAPDLKVQQFALSGFNVERFVRTVSRGNVSSLVATFTFTRHFGFYIVEIYMPSCLNVLTAFTAFWIDPLAVPARVTIGVFPTLIAASMLLSLRNQLPVVSYMKAADVYILVSGFFVFASLLEYAFVNIIYRQKPKCRHLIAAFSLAIQKTQFASLGPVTHEKQQVDNGDDDDISPSILPHESCENLRAEAIKSHALDHRRVGVVLTGFAGKPDVLMNVQSRDDDDDDESSDEEAPRKKPSCKRSCKPDDCKFCVKIATFSTLSGIQRVELIETTCRYVFPVTFALFNVTYWGIYHYD